MISMGILASSMSGAAPPAPTASVPLDNPTIPQSGMDTFTPTVSVTAPNPSAPILAWITPKARADYAINTGGHQFSAGTLLKVYGQTSTGVGPTACTQLYRSGNLAEWIVPATMESRAFMLAWPYDPVFGYGLPLKINAPEVMTVNCSSWGSYTGIVGDTCYLGGDNLCNEAGSPQSWVYLQPGSGSGQFATVTTSSTGLVAFTIPSVAVGTWQVWVHNGRGGYYGWHQSRTDLVITTAAAFSRSFTTSPAISIDLSTYTAISGGGPGSGVSVNTAWAAAIANLSNKGGIINVVAGVFSVGAPLSILCGSNCPVRVQGAGKALTRFVPLSGYTNDSNYGIFRAGDGKNELRDLTIDWSSGLGTNIGTNLINGTVNLFNVKVDPGSQKNVAPMSTGSYLVTDLVYDGCDFIGGIDSSSCVFVQACIGMVFNNCTFKMNSMSETALWFFFQGDNVLVRNCTVNDYVLNSTSTTRGRGRFIVTGYRTRGMTIIGNTTISLSVPPDSFTAVGYNPGDSNKGEQILVDGGAGTAAFTASGGSATTVKVAASFLNSTIKMRSGTDLTSNNATSGTPTVSSASNPFDATQYGGTGWTIKILSGTNSIPGTYPLTTATVTGAIGTAASISNIFFELYYDLRFANGTDLACANPTSGTPTITSASTPFTSADNGRLVSISAGVNYIAEVYKITWSGVALLDRVCGTGSNLTGGTWHKYKNYSREAVVGTPRLLSVVGGTGLGQCADVLTMTPTSTEIIFGLDRTFLVPTDSTSRVNLAQGALDISMSANTFAGDGLNTGASCGIEIFESSFNIRLFANSISGVNYGTVDWAPGTNVVGGNCNSTGIRNYFSDNTISNCNYISRPWGNGRDDYLQELSNACTTCHNTTISGIKLRGFWMASWTSTSKIQTWDRFVGSFGTGTSAPTVLYEDSVAGVCTMYKNSIDIGTGTFSGSAKVGGLTQGITITYSPAQGSQMTGFQS